VPGGSGHIGRTAIPPRSRLADTPVRTFVHAIVASADNRASNHFRTDKSSFDQGVNASGGPLGVMSPTGTVIKKNTTPGAKTTTCIMTPAVDGYGR
jgi:hypothetical protein